MWSRHTTLLTFAATGLLLVAACGQTGGARGLDEASPDVAANPPVTAPVDAANTPTGEATSKTQGSAANSNDSVRIVNGCRIEPRTRCYGADLSGADLSRADLFGAFLADANLTGANLTGADLRYAILSGVDLTGADLTGAQLDDATLWSARWTDGHRCNVRSIGRCV